MLPDMVRVYRSVSRSSFGIGKSNVCKCVWMFQTTLDWFCSGILLEGHRL